MGCTSADKTYHVGELEGTHASKGNTPIAHLYNQSFTWAEPKISRPIVEWLGKEGLSLETELRANAGCYLYAQCTQCCSQRSTWSRQVTPLACADVGMLICNNQQAADRPAGAVLSIAPWEIKVVA